MDSASSPPTSGSFPIAIVVGCAPIVMFTGPQKLAVDLDELGVAGALAGAPIEMAKAVTVDLDVPADAWQAMVKHHTADGVVPNCGFWMVRKSMREWLERVWDQRRWVGFGWWEQAALMELMGYRVDPKPARLVAATLLEERTHYLDHGWNYHCWDTPGPLRVRVAHATMFPDRETVMREWAKDGLPDVLGECGHRFPVGTCPDCAGAVP